MMQQIEAKARAVRRLAAALAEHPAAAFLIRALGVFLGIPIPGGAAAGPACARRVL